jgi:nitroimidazol reductase NimA-like FMN-containing flavoprotein (pyridoxamine 5'-phosphate oxidase superfamily)
VNERAATSVVHLERQECEELLARSVVGRLGVVVDGRPEIFPVSHVYAGGAVAFPTNDGTKLHAALAGPSVAFEVDGLERSGLTGWSVVVKGRAELLDDGDAIAALEDRRTVLWRRGPSVRWVRIGPTEVTGRRFEALPRPADA